MKKELKKGFLANMPISISVFVYGTVLGIICSSKGISLIELVLMNIFIFAGSSQFILIDMFSNSLNIFTIVTACLLVNFRYFLITASLNSLFINTTFSKKVRYMHFVTDENWAVTISSNKNHSVTPYFLLGGGFCIFITWFLGTFIGYYFGELISNPKALALDFAFLAMFTAVITSMYKRRSDILIFLFTALIAFILETLLDNMSYIVISSFLGSFLYVTINKGDHSAKHQ